MGKENKTIVGIDVGSNSIRVLAASAGVGGDLEMLSMGQALSLGVQRGIVSNIDEASFAIGAALEDAGLDDLGKNTQIYASVGGKHLGSVNSAGEAEVSRSDGLVSAKDVARAMDAAKSVDLPDDVRLLHQVPRGFRIDGYRCRRSPVGMHGARAHADTHLVTASEAAVRNLEKAVEMTGNDVAWIVAGGVAAGKATLRREEMEMGVILLDIGGGTTDIAAFSEGAIHHTSALPLGGNQIVNDIAIALNTALHVAEETLLDFGTATVDGIDPQEELTVQCFGMSGYRRLRRRYLVDVIRLRLTEIIQLGVARVRQAAPNAPATAGIVITGGVASIPGIDAIAEQATNLPARIGSVTRTYGGNEVLRGPGFATLVGILQVASDPFLAPVKEQKNGHHRGFRLLPQLLGSKA
jgi:cell division protein FtsA